MEIDALISAVRAIDTNNAVLISVLCLAGTYLFHEMIGPPFWISLLALLSMIASACIGVAVLKVGGIFASPEPGIATVVGAITGMTISFVLIAATYRITAEAGNRASVARLNARRAAGVQRAGPDRRAARR